MLVEKKVFGFFPSMSNSDSRVRSNALQSEFASAEMSLHAIYMHEVISCSSKILGAMFAHRHANLYFGLSCIIVASWFHF